MAFYTTYEPLHVYGTSGEYILFLFNMPFFLVIPKFYNGVYIFENLY